MREQEKAKKEGETVEPGPGKDDQIGSGGKNEWKWLVNFIRTK